MKLQRALSARDDYSYVLESSSSLTPAEADAVFSFFHTCGIFFKSTAPFMVMTYKNTKSGKTINILSTDVTSHPMIAEYHDGAGRSLVNNITRMANISDVKETLIFNDLYYSLTKTSGSSVCGFLSDVGKTKIKALVLPGFYNEIQEQGNIMDLFGEDQNG